MIRVLVKRVLGPFLPWIVGGVGLVALIASLTFYDKYIDDPAVAKAAREGYVLEAEKLALTAQLDEMQRQRDQANEILFSFSQKTANRAQLNLQKISKLEDDIDGYEAQLRKAGRSCGLTGADINWLRE